MKLKSCIRVFVFIGLIVLLYFSGLSLQLIVIFASVVFLSMILRGKIYRKLDEVIGKKFPALSKLHPIMKKTILILVFVLIYFAIKSVIFMIMKYLGVDIQQSMLEGINKSIGSVSS